MKILVVEDDLEVLDAIVFRVEAMKDVSLTLARSVDEAEVALETEFDVAVCDLMIPSVSGGKDLDTKNGLSIYRRICAERPATPVIVLSGRSTFELVTEIIEQTRQDDLFGTGEPIALRGHYRKRQLDICLDRIHYLAEQYAALDRIEVATYGQDLELASDEVRALQVVCRRFDGEVVKVRPLNSGKSGARTLLATIVGEGGRDTAQVVVKVNLYNDALEESSRCALYVTRLKAGVYAPHGGDVTAGTGAYAASYYSEVIPGSISLFERIGAADDPALVAALRNGTRPWVEGADGARETIRHVRRRFIRDEKVVALDPLIGLGDLADFEAGEVSVRRAVQHGDMHGGNILVAPDGRPLLIDYGRTGPLHAAVDPVTLELSLALHPDRNVADWPSAEALANWVDLDNYVKECPFPETVRALRHWAYEVAQGDREVHATVYGYALRQLQYPDHVPSAAANALVEHMREVLAT